MTNIKPSTQERKVAMMVMCYDIPHKITIVKVDLQIKDLDLIFSPNIS